MELQANSTGRTNRGTTGLTSLDTLFNDLVPAAGRATTVQGELVRAINSIAYEYENNGNSNWQVSRRDFLGQLSFLQTHLLQGPLTTADLSRALGTL